MNHSDVQSLLEGVRAGTTDISEATERLATMPFLNSEGAVLDTHRALRQTIPEVVFARGKSISQVADALSKLEASHQRALATRVGKQMARMLEGELDGGTYCPTSRLFKLGKSIDANKATMTAVVTAGTTDIRVAEEAAGTLEFFGHSVDRTYDIGVAGLHRLLANIDKLRAATAVIVVAGMDGALPSVVGGIVSAPVIAVPTSTGYGASFEGLSALLSMLNSCAPGVSVVNIDNGFGAAAAAMRIQQP